MEEREVQWPIAREAPVVEGWPGVTHTVFSLIHKVRHTQSDTHSLTHTE